MKKRKLKKWVENILLIIESILFISFFIVNVNSFTSIISEIGEIILYCLLANILIKYTDLCEEE